MNRIRLKALNWAYHGFIDNSWWHHARNNCNPYSKQSEWLLAKMFFYQIIIVILAERD